jgi:hypothetical protein
LPWRPLIFGSSIALKHENLDVNFKDPILRETAQYLGRSGWLGGLFSTGGTQTDRPRI